jgi:hypothetical protein
VFFGLRSGGCFGWIFGMGSGSSRTRFFRYFIWVNNLFHYKLGSGLFRDALCRGKICIY